MSPPFGVDPCKKPATVASASEGLDRTTNQGVKGSGGQSLRHKSS